MQKKAAMAVVVGTALGILMSAGAGAEVCQNCKEWTVSNPGPNGFTQQAACCIGAECSALPGVVVLSRTRACYIEPVPSGYRCSFAVYEPCTGDKCDSSGSAEEGGPGGCSPIIIDLDRDGIHLTGPADAVPFDFDGDGEPGHYGWTSGGTRDSLLCYDRDGNGRIEGGHELFGNLTPLSDGTPAPSGYHVLAELDLASQGGDEDGRVTPKDAIYGQLCLWSDVNHNGVSDAGELRSLDQAGVLELSYDYSTSQLRDGHGNEFRYKSSAVVRSRSGKPRRTITYDVFFASARE